MYELEILVLIVSGYFAMRFIARWYKAFLGIHLPERVRGLQIAFVALPVVALTITLVTLHTIASFDVVDDAFYIWLYALLGIAWAYLGVHAMGYAFDLSWRDDVVSLNNRAAAPPVACGYLAIALIYAAANIGDGPGWWCVVFAAGLGTGTWLLLGMGIDRCTGAFERITIDRDIGCGIRMAGMLLALGIVLARASAGDWTSFGMTIVEFADGWPALILAALAIVVERLAANRRDRTGYPVGESVLVPTLVALLYVLLAILAVMLLPPLPTSGLYSASPIDGGFGAMAMGGWSSASPIDGGFGAMAMGGWSSASPIDGGFGAMAMGAGINALPSPPTSAHTGTAALASALRAAGMAVIVR